MDVGARAFGYAVAAAGVEYFGVGALFGCHALDDGLDALEGVVVDVDVFELLAHAGYHGCEVFEVAHLLDLLDLPEEVVEVELVFLNLLLQALGLFFVELLLCALHERHDVAHTQDAVGHSRGVEGVDGFHLLARSHELDGLRHYGADGEGCTAACVAVELGEHHAVEVEAVVELFGGVDGVLTGHRVDHEERLVGVDGALEGLYLLHHLLVDGQSAGGVDDDCVVGFCLRLLDGVFGYLNDVLVAFFAIHGDAHLRGHDFELLDGGGSVDVAGYEQRVLALLGLEHVGQLAAEGGLTGALQA